MKTPLIRLALVAVALANPVMPASSAGEPGRPDKKLKVVVFGGHPDDPESGAGGLIATLTRQGHEVICAYGTAFRGDRRFFDRPEAEVRREEATAACKVLGATPKFFPYAHEKLVADEATLKAVSAWLDEVKPDIVVTHWPLDTHPNHHVVSSLVWRCYQRQGGWNLYFFEVMTDQQTLAFEPDLYLDIAPVREVKRRALDGAQEPGAGGDLGGPRADAPPPWGRVRRRVRRGVHAGRGQGGMPAAARHVPREEDPVALHLRRKEPIGPPRSPRRSGTSTASWSTPSSPVPGGEDGDPGLAPGRRSTGGVRHPVVYVLPVEARREHRYGDGLLEVRRHDLHNRFSAIFVAPTFSHLPWYADHPTDPRSARRRYFLKVVVPFVEGHYPAKAEPGGRLLLGFSKSGWGAFSLLLRHPDVFGKAAAWDAPLMMDGPGRYGSGDIFGTPENFEGYRVTGLLERRAADLRGGSRLILLGYGNFRDEHEQAHALMTDLKIPHVYEDGPEREHVWESGWVPEAVGMLMEGRTSSE